MNTPAAPLRVLWLAREFPFPLTTGDRIYSAELARSLAAAPTRLTYVGLEALRAEDVPRDWGVDWQAVPGRKKPYWRALFSTLPLVGAAHATRAYAARLRELLERDWDVVVVDHYAMGWVWPTVRRWAAGRTPRPLLVHVAQNHEETLSASLYTSYQGLFLKRLVLYLNYLKIRHVERRMGREADLVTTITAEDRDMFRVHAPEQRFVVLTPGYHGWVAAPRRIGPDCPRHVVLVGSYRWIVKQQNLRRLLEVADAPLHAAGVTLDVIGDVPDEVREAFDGVLKATRFHGFVDAVEPFFAAARLALVPEVIGGGFKLKFLDYIFGRVPVATIGAAAAGLPEAVRQCFVSAPTLEALVTEVLAVIDDDVRLDRMQREAMEAAAALFDWRDRGVTLERALRAEQSRRQAVAPVAHATSNVGAA